MTENLNKKPPKGILKSSSSFDTASCAVVASCSSSARRNSGIPAEIDKTAEEAPVVDDELSVSYNPVRKHSKTAKFDEMNILETYHPATKTYGHMKIEEPKTPFSYYDQDEELESSSHPHIDPLELAKKLEDTSKNPPSPPPDEDDDEDDLPHEDESPEDTANRLKFESKRKAHYNEYYAVKLARKLMEQEEDDDEDDEPTTTKFIPKEETSPTEDFMD